MEVALGVRSDVGLVRANNEDHFAADPELSLYVLCDGMGGQAAGEVASRMGVELIREHVRKAREYPKLQMEGIYQEVFSAQSNRLASGIRLSNRAIFEAASKTESVNGMGSTVVAVQISGNVMSVANVGDSRVYLMRNNELRQITEDHSLVREQVRQGLISAEEAERSELSNVILRALGAEASVEVDLDELWVGVDDQVLLCSDGLTRMVSDAEIAKVLSSAPTAQDAADRLVELANEKGGEDNTTVIVVRLQASRKGWQRLVRWFKGEDGAWPK